MRNTHNEGTVNRVVQNVNMCKNRISEKSWEPNNKIINRLEEKSMISNTVFKVNEGLSFIATTECRNIEALKIAAEKYEIEVPNARIIILYNDGMFEYYHELEGCGVTKFAFALEDQGIGSPCNSEDMDAIRKHAMCLLADNIDNMDWSKILKEFLTEEGAYYEED